MDDAKAFILPCNLILRSLVRADKTLLQKFFPLIGSTLNVTEERDPTGRTSRWQCISLVSAGGCGKLLDEVEITKS